MWKTDGNWVVDQVNSESEHQNNVKLYKDSCGLILQEASRGEQIGDRSA